MWPIFCILKKKSIHQKCTLSFVVHFWTFWDRTHVTGVHTILCGPFLHYLTQNTVPRSVTIFCNLFLDFWELFNSFLRGGAPPPLPLPHPPVGQVGPLKILFFLLKWWDNFAKEKTKLMTYEEKYCVNMWKSIWKYFGWSQNDPFDNLRMAQSDPKMTPKWPQSYPTVTLKWSQDDHKITLKSWSFYVTIIHDHHIWSSYMVIIYDHLWSSHMIKIYDHICSS